LENKIKSSPPTDRCRSNRNSDNSAVKKSGGIIFIVKKDGMGRFRIKGEGIELSALKKPQWQ
jgi:hypothetical protein